MSTPLPRAPSPTLESVIAQAGGVTSGFDYMRIGLALAVVCWHGILTTRGMGPDGQIWASLFRPVPALILPMFFCLSGFLVSGSLKRTRSITEFLTLRAIRIVPALAVEIFLSALLLGIALTTLPLSEYFSSSLFHSYFLNIFGQVKFYLPGVYTDNIFPGVVNLNLRTLPSEFECYLLLSGLVLFKFIGKPLTLLALLLLVCLVYTGYLWPKADFMQTQPPHMRSLVLAFFFGVCFYFLRERIQHSKLWFVLALLATVLLLLKASTQFLALPFITYITVYLGLLNPPKKSYLLRGDYSYGLYLFGFPLQQLYSHLWPQTPNWFYNVAFALTLGLGYAYLSWNLIEKPILLRKSMIVPRVMQAMAKLRSLLPGKKTSASADTI